MDIDKNNDNSFNDRFFFEAFKELSNLTHFTLYSNYFLFEAIKDIDIYLPNLQYIVLENRFTPNREEVTQMAGILSRLSKLKTLKLDVYSKLNDNEIENAFVVKPLKPFFIHFMKF